jgi:hypothetical protein
MWMAIAIIAAISAWIIIGGVSQNNSPPTELPFDDCAGCRRLWAWWDSLDFWGKLAGAAWYGLQSLGCAIKGCKRP